jgi:hypothetical protein
MANDAIILLGFKNSSPQTKFSVYATYHIQDFSREICAYYFQIKYKLHNAF